MPLDWYALVTKPNHEKAVFEYLKAASREALLPLYRARRRWSDRYKEIELPLFPGYVFARFSFRQRVPILRVPGVRTIVSTGPDPAPIPQAEIDALEAMVRSGLPVKPWPFLKVGQRVEVVSGPLKGVQGILLEFKKAWHIVMSVELLQRSVAVEIDRDSLSPRN
ncbi:MAG: transcription termination/antitermination protein NusG [Acidobacteriota bacterium]